MEVMLRMI
jgi:hypothetical protein